MAISSTILCHYLWNNDHYNYISVEHSREGQYKVCVSQ